ncbi:MAG: exo-alpha-sialidase [Akkermansia sp.]
MYRHITTLLAASLSVATASESFEAIPAQYFTSVPVAYGTLTSDGAKIINGKARTGNRSLHILGGANRSATVEFEKALEAETLFQCWMERWTAREPFDVRLVAIDGSGKETVLDETKQMPTGGYDKQVAITLPAGTTKLAIRSTTADGGGVLVDDLMLHSGPMVIKDLDIIEPTVRPIFKRADINTVLGAKITTEGATGKQIDEVRLTVSPASSVAQVNLIYGNTAGTKFGDARVLASVKPDADGVVRFSSPIPLKSGENNLWVDVHPTADSQVGSKLTFSDFSVKAGSKSASLSETTTQRIGYMVAMGGDDVTQLDGSKRASNYFRIPGLITTKSGALVGCYDARYVHGGDLCADIDVAFVRSTDGGQTWTNNVVCMDTGEGPNNGCGDPAILQDNTGRLWIQALVCHFGPGASLFTSQRGQDPKTTGQWYMTYSDDDGKTWTKDYVNPTKQIKKDQWHCILAGPGMGITLKDGTIVFPAQIWETGAPIRCQSTICYSKDGGKNWVYGEGLPHETSECQVVELADGSIMINARNEARSGKRAVYVTKDLGKTWEAHETNLNTLDEPVCQASIIAVNHKKYGRVLLFSNPKVTYGGRYKMTIRYSLDEGKTWSEGLEYDRRPCSGYSCLTMVDEDTVGLFVESAHGQHSEGKDLNIAFHKIPLAEIIEAK